MVQHNYELVIIITMDVLDYHKIQQLLPNVIVPLVNYIYRKHVLI